MSCDGESEMTAPGGFVDQAVAALGGEGSDFIVKGIPGSAQVPYAVGLFCRTCGSANGDRLTGVYSVGEIELWELAADAREHFEDIHAPSLRDAQDGQS